MKTAKDYPVKYKFGYSAAYGATFHTGEDRSCPLGAPVKVNNTVIGNTGSTGLSTGPHLHITRQRAWKPINPRGSGFSLKTYFGRKPKVIYTGTDSRNGKFVKVKNWQGDIFFYCHLSKITCKVGQIVK